MNKQATEMTMEIVQDQHHLIVFLDETSDQSAATELIQSVVPKIKERKNVAIDFSKVVVLSSLLIGALITINSVLPSNSPQVRLTNLSKNTYKVAKICHLDKTFSVEPAP